MDYLFYRRRRAANLAYAILVSGIPGPEASPPPNPTSISQPQAARKVTTRHPSYRFFGQKAGGCDVSLEISQEVIQRRRLDPPRRAANPVYFVNNGIPPADQPYGVTLTMLPDRAPAARRAAATAYDVSAKLPPPDELYGIKISDLPPFARAARRASYSAYDVSTRIFPEITDPPITIGMYLPTRADAPRRTAARAYDIAITPALPDEVFGIKTSEIPHAAPGPRRAANTAYLVNQPPPTPEIENPVITIGNLLPSRADGPLRAAYQTYVITVTVPPPNVEVVEPEIPFVPSEQPIPYITPPCEPVRTSAPQLPHVTRATAPKLSPVNRNNAPQLPDVDRPSAPKLGSRRLSE